MTHRLDRLELEIQVAEEALARPLQDRLSRLHHQTLAELLGRVLDELSPPGALHRLERLELHLGEIPADQLELLLPQRLERALREALPAELPNAVVSDAITTPAALAVPQALELLAAHAASGQLPWWAPRQNARLIPEALESALALPPQDLATWWHQEVPQAAARQRLLAAADPEQAARLRELLGMTLGEELEGVAEGGAPETSPGRETPQGRETSQGRGALEIAAPAAKPPPSPSAALPTASALDLLAAIAATGQLPWWAPRQNARLIPEALESALALPAHDLAAWWRQEVPRAAARQRLLAAADPEQAARLRERLGVTFGEAYGEEVEALEGVEGVAEGGAPEYPPGRETSEGRETSQGRGALEMAAPAAKPPPSPSAALPPASALDLLAAIAATGQLPWWATRQHARLIPEALEAALALPPQDLATWMRQRVPQAAARQRLLAAAEPEQAARLRERLAAYANSGRLPEAQPSPPDEPLTLDGAGLVMVSPFLETLFHRLAWLTPERRFLGPEEQRRAVALLGFLVDGEAKSPEWRLSLAKLLCGLELEALCRLDAPLSEAEQAEGEALLQAALAHGQGLLGDEIGPLRETILQRPALLSWRPGAWLLVVERREGDEVLAELPWSWSWIRLPWMEAVLQVVW